jgi:hypothetical protein
MFNGKERWAAYLGDEHIGSCRTATEAAHVHDVAARERHGGAAVCNFGSHARGEKAAAEADGEWHRQFQKRPPASDAYTFFRPMPK